VSALAFAPDGKTLAWMDNPGGRVFTVGLHGDTPTLLGTPVNWFDTPCFSPDGKTLALLTDARVIQLRDLATAKDVGALDAHDSPVYMVAFSPDGRGVVSESLTGFIAWEIAGARLLRRTPPGDVSAEHVIRLLPDGRLLTEERWAKRYRLRDARTGAEVWRFDAKPDVGEVAIAPGGRYAALCGQSSGCCVLDLATGRCRYRSAQPVFKPHLSADGNVIVWRRHGKEAGVAVYHHETGKTRTLEDLPAETELDYWLMRLDSPVSPDGRWLVLPKDDGSLRLWDLTTGKKLLSLADVQPTVWELIWSPDGRYLATRGRSVSRFVRDREDRPDLRVWDVAAGRRLPQLTIANFQGAARFSRDGRTLLTTDLDGVIHLWEVATGKERRRLAGHLPGEIRALAFSPDGRRLASGGSDSQVLVWDLR
jgi:WD40 repeat protein